MFELLTVMLYIGRLVTQYRKSANARLMLKMVVYFRGGLLKPNILFLRAQGIDLRVKRLPKAPILATIRHLKERSNKNL